MRRVLLVVASVLVDEVTVTVISKLWSSFTCWRPGAWMNRSRAVVMPSKRVVVS